MYTSLAYYVTSLRKDFVDYCNKSLSNIGLSQGQLYFLIYVGKHPSCSPKELAKALNMDIGHTARTIYKLEENNFLIQKQNPNDRRGRVLQLTEKGKDAFELSYDLFKQWDKEILQNLSDEEQDIVFSLMKKIIRTDEGMSCLRKDSKID